MLRFYEPFALKTTKMMTEQELKIMMESELRVWNEGDMSFFDEYVHPDFVRHEVGIQDDVVGITPNIENVRMHRLPFADFTLVIDEVMCKEDTAFSRWTIKGVHAKPFGELPPTGKKVEISGATISHCSDGKLIDQWVYYNQASLYDQLGFTLAPPDMMVEH